MRMVLGTVLTIFGFLICIVGLGVSTSTTASSDSPLGPIALVNFAGEHTQLITEIVGSVMFLAGIILDCTVAIVKAFREPR